MKRTTYIIVPGLWDQKPTFGWFYYAIGKWWRLFGMHVVVCKMNWISMEPYATKLNRLKTGIEVEHEQGRRVVLVGVSAGAAIAALGFAKYKNMVAGVVSISGLLALAPGDYLNKVYRKTSWFHAARAAERSIKSLSDRERKRILTIAPRHDDVIDKSREKVTGSRHKDIPVRGHMVSIIAALLTQPPHIKRFALELH